jgi:hypothetical protein
LEKLTNIHFGRTGKTSVVTPAPTGTPICDALDCSNCSARSNSEIVEAGGGQAPDPGS